MKKLLLFVALITGLLAKSQTLYWVGGSGNWNDAHHWSLTSGGSTGNFLPTQNTDLIFDDQSSYSTLVVNLVGLNYAKSIRCLNTEKELHLTGDQFSKLTCYSDFILNEKTYYDANSQLIFSNATASINYINFWKNIVNADVLIEDGSWNLQALKVSQSNTLKFNKGNIYINNSLISAGNFEAGSDNVVFNTTHGAISVNNKLTVGDKATFNSNDLIVIAQKNSASLYNVSPSVDFGKLSKVAAPKPSACTVAYTFTSPSCAGSCDGAIKLTWDPSCVPANPALRYDVVFLSGPITCAIPGGVNTVGPLVSPTFSIGGLCTCGGFLLDVLIFDPADALFFISITGQSLPAEPTPINLTFSAPVPAKCFGDCNGSTNVRLLGGTGPYTVSLTPPIVPTFTANAFVTTTVTNLCAGNYTFTATDSKGCVKTFTTSVSEPALLVPNGTKSDIRCNGFCTGSATVAPTGGNPTYTVTWSSGAPGSGVTTSGLCPGIVTATVVDTKNCQATFTTNIIQPPAITLTAVNVNIACGAVCNGNSTVTATGGTPPFTFTLSPGAIPTPSVMTGLCPGNYTVNATDALGCVGQVTFDIIAPPTLTAAPTQSNVLCNGVCSGTIGLNPSGGTPGYSYTWSPAGPNSPNRVGLCSGIYTYSVGDTFGCIYTNTVNITQPPAATLTINKTDITCNGICNGSATLTTAGGSPGFTYTWTPVPAFGQNTTIISGLCAGSYTVDVLDLNNCPSSASVNVTQPSSITPNASSVFPTCAGFCNGSINAAPSGGVGPYTYTLQAPTFTVTTSPPYAALCGATYTLIIQDFNGCSITTTINLNQPNPVTVTITPTPITCFGACNSNISSLVAGGTPAYTYTWSDGSHAATILGKCAGSYTLDVTDAAGCVATATVLVTSPPAISVTLTATNPSCSGFCDAIATATASGGTPGYSYSWLPIGPSANINPALCAGNYTVTVTDNFLCTQSRTISIVAPPAMTLTPLDGTVSCSGVCNGTVGINVIGGSPGYSFSWSSIPVQLTQTATALCPGGYIATVTDLNGCVASAVANVTSPPALTAVITGVAPSCNICIGAATVTPSGGTPAYSYTWTNSLGATVSNLQTASALCVGPYTVNISDASGCTTQQTVDILPTVSILITTSGTTLQCNGGCSGVATANPVGGSLPYSYTWTPTVPLQTAKTATALCAGIYTVLVQDALGCSNTETVSFVNPPAITLTVSKTDVTCNGFCNGTASVTAAGGTGALSILWLPGGQTTASVSALCPGIYTVNITDANACTSSATVSITEAASLTATFVKSDPTTCITSDGSINATISGGVPTYTISWLPGGSSANPLIGLAAGTYTLNILDAAGCTQSLIATLNSPTGPTVTVNTTSIACFGLCNGTATATAIGIPPLTYTWTSGVVPTNSFVTGLCAGNFAVSVQDGNSCVTVTTLNIAQPAAALSSAGVVTDVSCSGVCTGSVDLTPSGGTVPYSFAWVPAGGAVEDPTGLCVGNYTVTITDKNLCTSQNTFTITQPSSLSISFTKRDVLCNGVCTGTVAANVLGGTAPYSYTWTPLGAFPGSPLSSIVNLCSGIYSVTVTDLLGCSITSTIDITEPSALTTTITGIDAKCNGQCNGSATVTVAGGTLPYSYNWNTTPVAITQTVGSLCAGNYLATVTDGNGCVSSKTIDILQPAPISITVTATDPSCVGSCNGSFTTTISGGNPAYTFNWIPIVGAMATVQNPSGLCQGNYTLTVTDASLCVGLAVGVLTDPAPILPNITFTNPSCSGSCNGIVTSNPTGGTPGYTYAWTAPLAVTKTVGALCPGTYTLVVTDANLCTATQTVTLVTPPPLTLNPAVAPASCGVSNGTIDASIVSGTPPITYDWLPPVPLAQKTFTIVTGLGAGIYTVIVTDVTGCTATVSIPLSNTGGPTGATLTQTNVICNGQCNGAAAISAPVGGTPGYTLSWVAPVSASTLITSLCPGSYTAQIKDAAGCLLFVPATITEPPVIDDSEVLSSSTCFGICDGSISLTPTGGNGGYTYAWSPAAPATGTISSLCPGTYTAVITDALGCSFTGVYNLPSLTTITSATVGVDNVCFGDCKGSLSVVGIAGGLPPYSLLWSDPLGQTSPSAIGLCNGGYSVTITDAAGCFNIKTGTITSAPQIVTNPTFTNPSCGLCNGTASLSPTGGNGGFSFVWSNMQIVNPATGLCAGVYGVKITDALGCVTNTNVVINSSSGITSEIITKADETCESSCNGTVNITAVGGVAPITYNWVHNGSTSQSLVGLCAGTYFCNMKDANGCSRTASVVISSATSLIVTSQVNQTACGLNTGSITVSVSGGLAPYSYAWLPAGATPTITNLAAGIYTLTVTDANGCSKVQTYAVNSIAGPSIDLSKTDANCTALCSGSASITISGGTPVFTTNWSNGVSGVNNINGLCSGTYSVKVTDNVGCIGVANFSISPTVPILFSAPDIHNPKCNGDCNGSITAIPSGGLLPFTYSWTPTNVSSVGIATLCPGSYTITITDAQGCSVSQTYSIANPPLLVLNSAVSNPTCSTAPTGSIDITTIGGTPGYTYTWSGSSTATTEDLNNVGVGTYTLSVTDASGCVKTISVALTSTLIVDANAGRDTTFCENGSLLLDGSKSIGGLTFDWFQLPSPSSFSNLVSVSVLPPIGTTTYVLLVANGTCVDRDTINVTSNPLPIVDAGPFVNIPIYSSSPIGGSPTGPAGSSYTWTPNFGTLDNPFASNPTASNTVTIVYTVTVKDANGCMNSDTVTVFIYPEIVIPNGFSPNSDGKNDVWKLDNIQGFPDNVVEVYNRWGELLFYSQGYAVPFDGKYKGKDLPVGTYYYIIDLHHSAFPKAYTGPLTIFR